MLSVIGSIVLGLGFLSNLYAVGALLFSNRRDGDRWEKSGRIALFGSAALLLIALLILVIAFLTNHFEIQYIAQHSNRDLPFYLKLSAVWAGQEGSLLLWAFLQVLFAVIVSSNKKENDADLSRCATVILAFVAIFFTAMTLIFSNPFIRSASTPMDGLGMNPLLRHPGMVFHPPILYVGYVGLAVPFAYAIASLITNQVDNWYRNIRYWLLISWLALGIGIILGSRWAYDVLGWGGYWGWDAVENAGLMPWLTATALLHGISEQKSGKGFKVWNITLAAFSFWLVLFGTFTTRSGLIQSVHAFAQSQSGPYFLALLIGTLVGIPILMILFRKSLGELIYPEKVFSKEGATFFTLLLLILITLSILAGTLLPTLTDGRFAAPAGWFNRVVGPQLAALVLLMGICPILGRFGRAIKTSKWRVTYPIAGLILVPAAAYLNGLTKTFSLVGFAVAGFAGGTAIGEIVYLVQQWLKRKEKKEGLPGVQANRIRSFGGLLVHLGVVLIAIGVIGTQVYASGGNITLSPGETEEVGGYTLIYEGLSQTTNADHLDTWASVAVYRGELFLTTLKPNIAYYPSYNQAMAEPAIRSGIVEDLYIVLFQYENSGDASFNIRINPLSAFLWLGSFVLVVGGLVAWWPAGNKLNQDEKLRWLKPLSIIVGFVVILLVVLTLWGNPFSSTTGTGRPLSGDLAPEITSHDYQGNQFNLADYKGKAVVLHFWASWCVQCEDELRLLEEVWQQEQQSNTIFVGVALNDDQRAVEKIADDLGLSFILVPDQKGDISQSYGVTAVPETFFIKSDGKIASFQIGLMDESDLRLALGSIRPGVGD
jgi:cytochrome c-type biogenesis protein CcmF